MNVPSGYVKIAMENGPVEIVDIPSYKMVDLSICKRLPEGNEIELLGSTKWTSFNTMAHGYYMGLFENGNSPIYVYSKMDNFINQCMLGYPKFSGNPIYIYIYTLSYINKNWILYIYIYTHIILT